MKIYVQILYTWKYHTILTILHKELAKKFEKLNLQDYDIVESFGKILVLIVFCSIDVALSALYFIIKCVFLRDNYGFVFENGS